MLRVWIATVVVATRILGVVAVVEAQTLWLAAEPIGFAGNVHVCCPDELQLGLRAKQDLLATLRLWRISEQRRCGEVAFLPGEESLCVAQSLADQGATYFLSHDFGISTDDSKARIIVHAKCHTSSDPSTWQRLEDAKRLPLEMTLARDLARFRLTVHAGRRPVAGAKVIVTGPGSHRVEGVTDSSGEMPCTFRESGLYAVRTMIEDCREEGVTAARHMATLTLPVEVIQEQRAHIVASEIRLVEKRDVR